MQKKKEIRELRVLYEESLNDIKLLKRKVKRSSTWPSHKKNELSLNALQNKKMRHAKKEVSNMKKRLRLAMNDMDKQSRYYELQIKNIKKEQLKKRCSTKPILLLKNKSSSSY
eukprot:373123_1